MAVKLIISSKYREKLIAAVGLKNEIELNLDKVNLEQRVENNTFSVI